MRNKEQYEANRRWHEANSRLDYLLDVFGDTLAEREGYTSMGGLEAVHFYLMQKHHWPPAQVRSMPLEDLRFALTAEMQGWTLPKTAL